ncbi:MAG: hypothetical protein HRF43_19155 [Phycisphaerae bacterium]|jgi:hypothetical protein
MRRLSPRVHHSTVAGLIPLAAVLSAWAAPAGTLPAGSSAPPADVLPWKLPEQTSPEIRAVQRRLYHLAMMQARFALGQVHPWAEDPRLLLVSESKSVELGVRPNTATVEGLSFLYRHGPYDEKIVGVRRETLFHDVIIPMMRYLATTHVTGPRPTSDGKKWGQVKKPTHEQSTYWASMLGRAAWWNWDELPRDLRDDVRRVVAYEADWVAANPPQFRLDYDTKSEENAWHCTVLSSALLILPNDPRREKWEKTIQRYAIGSYLRPADKASTTIVDGRPVSEQFEGANIFDDFTLENHGFVHPDYMGAFSLTLGLMADYLLTGRKPPEAFVYNVADLYANLKWLAMPDGCNVFPNGQDWELFKAPDWMDVHAPAAVFLKDPHAWSNFLNCLRTAERMQARDPTGPVYAPQDYYYFGLQHELLYQLVHEWMTLQVAGEIVDRPTPILGLKRWENGRVVVHRTPLAVHTLSWGARVMVQCVPVRLDYAVSPEPENGVGHVLLAGQKRGDPLRVAQDRRAPLHDARIRETPDGFAADLVLDHGPGAVRAELHVESRADGRLLLREKLTALKDVTTAEIATGLIGLLNNPAWVYQKGGRTITLDGQAEKIAPLSGKLIEGRQVRHIDVDGILEITSPAPLRVRYAGANEIERGRATDRLYLNDLGGERSWRQGQVISQYQATIGPAGK